MYLAITALMSPIALYERAADWAKTYGDPITVWSGVRPLVIVNSAESFKEVAGPLRCAESCCFLLATSANNEN